MKTRYLFILGLAFTVFSCKDQSNKVIDATKVLVNDTIVHSKKDSLNPSTYHATEYFVETKNDTSSFKVVFASFKSDGSVRVKLHYSHTKTNRTNSQRLNELGLILKEASKEYKLDSIKSFFADRLYYHGDLAITVTEEFNSKFGIRKGVRIKEYKEVQSFLMTSSLAKEFNNKLESYDLEIEKIGFEKIYFFDKRELYNHSLIARDSTDIPDRILDGMIWISVKEKELK